MPRMMGSGRSLARHAPAAAAALAAFALLLMLLVLAAAPIRTNDFWFHLKAGETYATEGPWPAADPMLHTASEGAPVQHEWLFGVTTWALHQTIGFHGLRVVHAAAAALAVAFALACLRRAGAPPALALAGCAAFVSLGWWRLIQLRPDLFSIAATLATYLLLLAPARTQAIAEGPRADTGPSNGRIAAAAALACVWANMHSLFAIGPLLIVAALAGLALRSALARVRPALAAEVRGDVARMRRLALALAAMIVASALNPRGFAQHLTFLHSSAEAAIWSIGDEWRSFQPFALPDLGPIVTPLAWAIADLLLLFVIGFAVFGLVRLLRDPSPERLRRLDAVHLALAAAGCVALLTSIRFLWMGLFPLLLLARALPHQDVRPHVTPWLAAGAAVAMAALFPTAGGFLDRAGSLPHTLRAYLDQPFAKGPYYVRGVRFLGASGVEGNLYNRYTLGGFLGYWLSPRLRTFVDGRTEHYPAEVLDDYFRIAQQLEVRDGETALEALDRRSVDLYFGVGLPVAGQTYYTTARLDRAEGWLQISRSIDHSIFLRRNARNRANLERVERYYASAGVPFDRERGFDPLRAAYGRPDWALEEGVVPADYPLLLAALERGDAGQKARARERLALLYYLLGAYEQQIELDRESVLLRPDDFAPRARLVHALLRLGRDGEAGIHAAAAARSARAAGGDARRSTDLIRLVRDVEQHRISPGSPVPAEAAINGVPLLSPAEMARFLAAGRPAIGNLPDA